MIYEKNIYIYYDKYLPETIVNLVINQRTAIRYLRTAQGNDPPTIPWLVVSTKPSEKSWSEFVSWDDDIPNMMGKS